MSRIRRRQFLLGTTALFAARLAHAQERPRVGRIGWLASDAPTDISAKFWRKELPDSLQRLGLQEGKNLLTYTRYAENKLERLSTLAEELVRLKVDLIVTFLNVSTLAAKRSTHSIPIVMATSTDPVANGLINSYARPGGNVTGVDWWAKEQLEKQFQIAKEVAPRAKRAAWLWNRAQLSTDQYGDGFFRKLSERIGLSIERFEITRVDDLTAAFDRIVARRAEVLVVQGDPFLRSQYRKITAFALRQKLVSIAGASLFMVEGGLLYYGPLNAPMVDRVASYVDRILRGAKPGDLPVEQPTRYELVLNMKAATAIGLTLSPTFMLQVDRTIE